MQKILTFLFLTYLSAQIFAQPCTLNASAPKDTIVCGEGVLLSAFGNAQGNAFLSENFNNGSYGPGWQSTQQAMWNNPCGAGPDGTTHIWMGNSSPVPRILTTASFNLSSCANAGVTICFDMKFATQGNNSPCEGPDEPQEGVYLQYSTDNGATWITIHYFDPNGGNDPQLINWRNWCFPVPAGALTANTKFRWFQDADSGADYDHWGLDNVVIYCNDPTFSIVWPDGYNGGPTGGTNPTPVAPHTTTTYVVTMSNGTTTCTDSVTLVVVNPQLVVNAGLDTTICSGQCVTLNGTANVIQRPAKTPIYSNQETATITGTPGFPGIPPIVPAMPGSAYLNMDINITSLNLNTVAGNYITSVCIGSLNMLPFFSGVGLFDIYLVCPSGDSILLLKDSTITGTTLTNTCFTTGGSDITLATSPYSGSYAPAEPFSNLTGCDANGVWSLRFRAVINGIALPQGTFDSWSITFNDPQVSYPGTFSWGPTTGMTNSNTLTPTVCGVTGDYTLTVSDTAGCVTQTDVVRISDQACCNFTATATATQTACGSNTGSIDVTPSVLGSYTYAWSDGPATTASRTGLAAGTYTVTITSGSSCSITRTVVVSATGAPVLATTTTGTGCSSNTGSATVTVTSGTATAYEWSNGATTATASNLAAGTYNVTVTAGAGCTATATAVVNATGGVTISVASTNTTCGGSNGTATVTVTSGTASSYNWSSGASSAMATNLAAGTYTVTVNDAGGCSATASIVITGSGGSNVSVTSSQSIICGGDSAEVCAPAGYADYLWNTGQTSQCIFVKQAGSYYLTVTDQGNCTATSNHVAVNMYPLPPVSVSVDGDSLVAYGSVTYQWYLNGQPIDGATDGVLIASESGIYTVLVGDANGCTSLSLPINISLTTGIDDVTKEAMSIYPNPSYDGNWTLSVSQGWLNGECEMYDARGRLVYKAAITEQKSGISLSVQSGVYVVRVMKGNMAVTTRLIKL